MERVNVVAVVIASMALFVGYAFAQDDKPSVVAAVAPVFPAVVMPLKLEGAYQVDVEIDRTGKVVSSKTIEGTHKLMRSAIEAAADRWQFEADEHAAKRRRVRLTFVFRYTPGAKGVDSTPTYFPPYKIEVREHLVLQSN